MDNKYKKALSVNISSVLLFVAVIAIASITGGWFKGYFKDFLKSTEKDEMPKNCDKVGITIRSVSSGDSGVIDKITEEVDKTFLHDSAYQQDNFNITINDSNIEVTMDITPIPY